jgi:inward rectifier potassium channel
MSTMARTYSPDELRDLGFGSVVAQEQKIRLLNRDGSFNVAREGFSLWTSLSSYHALLTMSWTKFISLITVGYLLVNAVFAMAFMMCGPGALENETTHQSAKFLDEYFFSVHTFATIGYGYIVPKSLAANIVVTIESLVGLLAFALATGLIFARFSRPTAKILYSESAVIAPYRGITAFQFRITNGRSNQLIEVAAEVLLSKFEMADGKPIRRFYPLSLERNRVTFFPLTWTVVHPIDDASPLKGITREELDASHAEFLILLTGIDETFSQTVHSRSSYKIDEVVWNAKFANVFSGMHQRLLTVDMARFNELEQLQP